MARGEAVEAVPAQGGDQMRAGDRLVAPRRHRGPVFDRTAMASQSSRRSRTVTAFPSTAMPASTSARRRASFFRTSLCVLP